MDLPFLAEIQWVSFNFAAEGLGALQRPAAADQPEPGALLPARHHLRRQRPDHLRTADLRGRVAIGEGAAPGGSWHTLGEAAGEEAHTLTVAEMPPHTHGYPVTDHRGSTGDPGGPGGTT